MLTADNYSHNTVPALLNLNTPKDQAQATAATHRSRDMATDRHRNNFKEEATALPSRSMITVARRRILRSRSTREAASISSLMDSHQGSTASSMGSIPAGQADQADPLAQTVTAVSALHSLVAVRPRGQLIKPAEASCPALVPLPLGRSVQTW